MNLPTCSTTRPDPTHLTSGFSSASSFRRGFASPETEKVHVAVGKSLEKGVGLIGWSVKKFSGREICILHVHQPAQLIPTLLGKLPASKANPEVVRAYRKEEKEQKMKLLESYLIICGGAKVKASITMVEADEIQKGIVEAVHRHGVRKLVMGAIPENCMKVKQSSSKASYAAKNAPLFCEIWFINKGKTLWTRAASEGQSFLPTCNQLQIASEETFENEELHPECLQSSTANNDFSRIGIWFQSELGQLEAAQTSSTISCSAHLFLPHNINTSSGSSSSSGSVYSSAEGRTSIGSDLYSKLTEATLEVEVSKEKASSELLKCRRLELEATEAIDKVKAFEFACAREVRLRVEAEDALRITLEEQERILEENEEISTNIKNTMRNIALLDSRVHEANRRSEEASKEVKQIQDSIAALCQEKQGIQRQKMEAIRWLERWRSHRHSGAANYNGPVGSVEELHKLAEFPLSDLQTATCNFSESFKIGQGGYGCVYKGEMLGRTVAIRKLHPHNMQGQLEFQQEVQVLCKIQHPHLVTLLGVCPEAWSLVYEYLPNGSLQDHLFRKNNVSFMTWKTRVCIIAEISSALCFLHSSKPEKIVHGDLKPQNILLDSEFRCKICDFGICRLVTEENLYAANFLQFTEPKGAFSYTDPELQRNGVLTPSSDVYSFGLIILQLVTRKPPVGFANEVRRALLSDNLSAILDMSAGEWPETVAKRLVQLGLQCCELNSRARPELTPSLVREFEQLHVSEERPVPSFFVCPIRQEIMLDPQVAADGFTYEGEAMIKWLQNGKDTSPMTNLKLNHLHLTPNHALRLAIQDWLCKKS